MKLVQTGDLTDQGWSRLSEDDMMGVEPDFLLHVLTMTLPISGSQNALVDAIAIEE